MGLSAGARLGPYEVLAPLGAGGMGEVYRAKDTRLGREVAVKVLPASFSQDPDRLRRFEQEAKAASALNHPNIISLFDVGSHGGAPYVVSELLEGETLRSRLATGSLSPRKATDYAIQIAQGLAAAHEKGIVHRDLKPENLFVTEDGRVKILDFGLAKLIQPEATGQQQTSIPTASQGTEPGVVMGTARLHVARAGQGPAGRPPLRHFLLRRDPLRDALGGEGWGERCSHGNYHGNLSPMKTTIDSAGRLVVPKKIREAAGILPGSDLTIRVADGRIEIEPAPLEVRLVKRGSLTVAVPRKRVAPLTREAVRQTLDRLRRRGAGDAGESE
ncbi:MAG: protein kinase domain-containing protein [Thermoanaerobaculia bacterium]